MAEPSLLPADADRMLHQSQRGNMRFALALGLASVFLAACGGGIGVQSEGSRNCASIKQLTVLNEEVKTVDARILNNTPAQVTPEAIEALAQDYRREVAEYNKLLERSRAAQAELESAER